MKKLKKVFLSFLILMLFFLFSCANYVSFSKGDIVVNGNKASNIKIDLTVYKDSVYNQKEEVALYLISFKSLPKNYVSRDEFSKIANQFTIDNLISCCGGSFQNREKRLPLNDKYIECDINYKGLSRGAERIVFNVKYNQVYYTSDHYGTFVRVYDNYKYDNQTMFM